MFSLLKNKTQKGFSIGEVLLSAFILVVGVIGAVELTQKNVIQTATSRDTIIATALAQEGLELVRAARDENAMQRYYDKQSGTDPLVWRTVFESFDGSRCFIDYKSVVPTCPAGYDASLMRDNGFYRHGLGTATKFSRSVSFAPDTPAVGQMTVTSLVSFDDSDPPTDLGQCTIKNDCVFAQTILSSWISVDE